MLKKLALSIALIWGAAIAQNTATSLEAGVIYNTGNLVNNTTSPTDTTGVWKDIGSWNQGLPCWGPGGPVYCGPLPYFNNGSLNYSYGTADVRQTVNINAALNSIGSGLRVNGYNFGFTAKNGNGWDDGRVDYLTAYVRFVDPTNKSVFDKNYDLNYKFNWTTFNFSETFTTPYAAKDLGAVTYGIVGRDNNFWAGPYGPEVQNINFSLKYSVDPCAKDVLSSPTCPGYLEALAKLTPAVSTTTTTTTEPVAATVTTVNSTASITTSSQPSIVAPVVSAPAPVTTTASSTSNKESSSASTSLALSIISKNSERDKDALGVAQTATAAASQAALASQQEAAAVAAGAVANSVAVNAVNIGSQQSTGTGLRATTVTSNLAMATTSAVMGLGSIAVSMLQPPAQTQPTASSSVVIAVEPAPAPVMPPMNNNSAAQATPQSYAVLPPNFLTDRTNPLTDIVEGRQNIPAAPAPVAAGPVVNTNAGDNDAAGGVSINRMALAPTGYGDYLNFALRDAVFYAPKEVYKNQRTVDNARALRQLSSDVRHREMVEQQYRR